MWGPPRRERRHPGRGDDDDSRRGRGDAVAVARAPPSPDPHPAARTAARDGGGDGGTRTEGPRSAAGRTRRRRVDVFGCPCPLWDSGGGATKTGRMGTGDSTAGSHGEKGERKENPKTPMWSSRGLARVLYGLLLRTAPRGRGPRRPGAGWGGVAWAPGPSVSRCVGGAITTRCGAGCPLGACAACPPAHMPPRRRLMGCLPACPAPPGRPGCPCPRSRLASLPDQWPPLSLSSGGRHVVWYKHYRLQRRPFFRAFVLGEYRAGQKGKRREKKRARKCEINHY